MNITIVVYQGFTALDAVGPYEVLSRIPGAQTTFVAPRGSDVVRTDNGVLAVSVDGVLEDVEATDLLLVAGGHASGAVGAKPEVREALRRLDASSRITASVCTGSLILAAAGLLDGKRATTHWAFLDALSQYGAIAVAERVVVDGKVYTAAGVSAGIDMALRLTADLTSAVVAETIQLGIEYDPAPPFDAGAPGKAPPAVVEALRARFAAAAVAEV